MGKGIQASLAKRVKRRKLTQWNADVIAERLTSTLDYSKIANSDIIIEAVPEVLDLKHRIIKEVEAVANIVDRLERLADKIGPEFTPSQILYDMAKSGKTFY